jgi:hypothetical protein
MPTEIWRWQLRKNEENDEEEKATLIKSADPHLAGGEQQKTSTNLHQILNKHPKPTRNQPEPNLRKP